MQSLRRQRFSAVLGGVGRYGSDAWLVSFASGRFLVVQLRCVAGWRL